MAVLAFFNWRGSFVWTKGGNRHVVVTPDALAVAVVAATTGIPSIRIPKEVPTLSEPPKVSSFEDRSMSGAEVSAELCKDEELAGSAINAIMATGVLADRATPLDRKPIKRKETSSSWKRTRSTIVRATSPRRMLRGKERSN